MPIHEWSVPKGGTSFCRILVAEGKGCSSSGHPSSSVTIGILDVMEVEIWLPDQISVVPMGCKSAVSTVPTFLPITDGYVAWPLWVWNASSRGHCLKFLCGVRVKGPDGNPECPFGIKNLCPRSNRISALVLPDCGDIES